MADFSKIVNFDGGIKGVVDDGTQAIPIENKFGKKICTIYIRPGDYSIIDRYKQVENALPGIVEPLKNMGINNDGTAEFEKDWELLKSVERDLYTQLNYLFDMDDFSEYFDMDDFGQYFDMDVFNNLFGMFGIDFDAELLHNNKYLSTLHKLFF